MGLCLLVADADDFVVDLLRGSGAAAGGVDVEDDGLDGGVVAELAELGVDFVGVEDDAVEIDDADFGAAEAVETSGGVAVESCGRRTRPWR